MDDTKDLTETLNKLTEVLEAAEKTVPREILESSALQVDNQTALCKKYLSPKGLEALNLPRAKQLLHGENGVITHRCVYYGVRVKTSEVERGVHKMAEIMNDLAEKGVIHSILAEPSSFDLFRMPGEEQTSVVVFYPLVPVAYADELDKARPKYYIREGEVGATLDDVGAYKKVLPAGQFMAIARVTHNFLMMEEYREFEVPGVLFNIVQEHLKLLPEGTKFLGAKRCGISDLSVPYELYFENSLLPDVSEVDIEYVRAVAAISDHEVKQFNVTLGIRYFDKAGKLRYPHS